MFKNTVKGQAVAAAPLAAIIAWAWNGSFPDMQMTVEVAGAMGGVVGPAVAWLVSWLPAPKDGA